MRLTTTAPFTCTPAISAHDNRELSVRQLQYNVTPASTARSATTSDGMDERISCTQYDELGRAKSAIDARLFTSNAATPNLQGQYDLMGNTLRSDSVDAGFSVMLLDAEGRPVWQTDGRKTLRRWEYEDTLGRPVALYEQPNGGNERVSERYVYAEASSNSQALNLCGQCTHHYDTAGLNVLQSQTITGHPIEQQRTLLKDIATPADWAGDETDWATLLDSTTYTTQQSWNATDNLLTQTDAKSNVQRLSYAVDGQLAASWLTLSGQSEQPVVTSLSYSAAGQKLQEVGGNGVATTYTYEPQTQRLLGITTSRPASGSVSAATLQALNYGYDPVGNILSVSNDAEATRFYRNQKVTPESTYAYDALYQLISASGRESDANTHQSPDLSALITPLPTDSSQYVNYIRAYTYDRGGNLTQISHNGASQYTTAITVSDTSNHAVQAASGLTASDVESQFDANGNQKALQSGSPTLAWTLRNELQQVTPVVRDGAANDQEIYLYDGGSMRIVKQTTQLTGGTTQTQTVIYLPGLELRTTNNGTKDTEVLDVVTVGEAGRAQVRVLHWENGEPDGIKNDELRYSYGDQIGSVQLELDSTGQVISQEEYYPYGGTSLWAARSSIEADYKTLRYSGKERDATGLYYYGYRYYQPWIGRWLSADPAGTVDGLNLYRMVRNNPIGFSDGEGLVPVPEEFRRGAPARTRPRHSESDGDSDSEDIRYVYRSLRSNEDVQVDGAKPPEGYDPIVTALTHVRSGTKAKRKSSYVSFTHSKKTAAVWAAISKGSKKFAKFKVPNYLEINNPEERPKVYDLVTEAGQKAIIADNFTARNEPIPSDDELKEMISNYPAINFAKASQEILIKGGLDKESVYEIYKAEKISPVSYRLEKAQPTQGVSFIRTRATVKRKQGKASAPIPVKNTLIYSRQETERRQAGRDLVIGVGIGIGY